MSRRDRMVLRAFAVWSVFVWGVLIRNMLKDHQHGFGFRAVHIVLAVISISFAAATWLVASRSARAARSGGTDRAARPTGAKLDAADPAPTGPAR